MKFGIVGSGMIAAFHAQALAKIPQAQLAGVYSATPGHAAAFAQKYGCKAYPTREALLQDSAIEIICVCTPSGQHADDAVAAAQARKHVLIEKPMATTLADADRIMEAGEKKRVLIGVVSQLCFSPAVEQAKQAVQAGALGKLVLGDLSMKYYRSPEYYQSAAWRGTWELDGGGALMNQGIHGVDVFYEICGRITSVTAHARTRIHDIAVEDTVCALLELENGALATMQASTAVHPGYARRLEICGSAGSIVLEEDQIVKWDCCQPVVDTAQHSRSSSSDPANISLAGHRCQLENMIAAVQGKEPLRIDAARGRIPLEIILAIYQSACTGKTVQL